MSDLQKYAVARGVSTCFNGKEEKNRFHKKFMLIKLY